ncbi:hypothetical protein [Myroides profundi]|uniref:Uncharacterized protein n=1 Tax=Myroides profundi TaxID=480520 RepID=A0AAJ4W245_MYRPR|nr:hypothetical protein [Myroides profundi]AJH14168.1 hypothetical protein MPR_0977 [Myroides profundi]SEQ39897.1 hypothetical protein SAMN04488089_10342 [Myroides profundi]
MIKKVIIGICLLVGISVNGQVLTVRPPHPGVLSRSPLIEEEAEVKEENKLNLQEYVERLYHLSSAWYNDGALPVIKSGEYLVIIVGNEGKYNSEPSYSKDLVGIKREDVKSIEYNNGPSVVALYGAIGGVFGVVFVTLK